jgi:hypothetical protein
MHVYHDRSLAVNQLDALFRELDEEENYLSQKKCLTKEEAKKYRKRFSIELAATGLSHLNAIWIRSGSYPVTSVSSVCSPTRHSTAPKS